MVSRRTSLVLLVALLLVGVLVRGLLREGERPSRQGQVRGGVLLGEPDVSPPAPLAAPEAVPSPEVEASERESLPAGSPLPDLPEPPRFPRPPEDDGSVFVSVLDAQGRPAAGLPIGLFFVEADLEHPPEERPTSVWTRARSMPIAAGITDASGGLELTYRTPTQAELVELLALIAPELEFVELPVFETGRGQLPPSTVVLRLPPAGSIRVRVKPAELAEGSKASVEAVLGGHLRRSVAVTEGEALFPFVELGKMAELRLTTAAMANRPTSVMVQGPKTQGETVEAELLLDAWPSLRFRVCDETGRPLANTILPVRIHHGKLSPQSGNARTDADGEAEFVVYGTARNEDARELLVWTTSPPRLAQLWLPEFLETPTELGTVLLRRVAPDSVPPR